MGSVFVPILIHIQELTKRAKNIKHIIYRVVKLPAVTVQKPKYSKGFIRNNIYMFSNKRKIAR